MIVHITGEIDPSTGYVMDMKVLKDLIKTEVEDAFDHKNLNEQVPEFANLNPTAENIAVVIWNKLRPHISSKNRWKSLFMRRQEIMFTTRIGMLYPLFFKPISKERLWGGRKLMGFLNKPLSWRE